MRNRQTPDALNGVDAVADPGIAVIAVNSVSRARGEQPADRVLASKHHAINRLVERSELLSSQLTAFKGLVRQNHGVNRDRI